MVDNVAEKVNKRSIKGRINRYFDLIGKETIHDNGVVDVHGCVKMRIAAGFIPVQWGKIEGHFECSHCYIESLQGSPTTVGGDFFCHANQLASLQGAPSRVGGDFNCKNNPLKSLQGLPEYIGGMIFLDYDPELPLLRLLTAEHRFRFLNTHEYSVANKIADVLNQFAGQGKRGVPACVVALNNLQKELGVDIRENIKW